MTEVVTIYSLMDIGDIFSLEYIDEQDLVVFGSQNASLLYVGDVFKQTNTTSNYNMLPHRRFDRFFDSNGPQSQLISTQNSSMETLQSNLSNTPGVASPYILEVPSANILPYAHNGFIYSIVKLDSIRQKLPIYLDVEPGLQYVLSGGGDGMSKVWSLKFNPTSQHTSLCFITELDNIEPVLSQVIEFPFLYVGLTNGILKIWDLNTNQLVSTLYSDDKSDITSLAVFQDHVFASQQHGITKFYQDEVYHWKGHPGNILSSEIICKKCSNNPYIRLITGANDGSLVLWNINNLIAGSSEDLEFNYHSHEVEERLNSWTGKSFDNDHMLHNLSLIHI